MRTSPSLVRCLYGRMYCLLASSHKICSTNTCSTITQHTGKPTTRRIQGRSHDSEETVHHSSSRLWKDST